MGRLHGGAHLQEHAHHRLRRREDFAQGKRETGTPSARPGAIWCFTLNRRFVRDASVGGNLARFINHACRPNCYVEIAGDTIWIRASRNIAQGEELTYNYQTDGEAVIQCRCRPDCATKL